MSGADSPRRVRYIGRAGPALALLAILATAIAVSMAAAGIPAGLFGALLACAMLAIAVTDARRFIIPDELTAAALILALIWNGAARPGAGFDPASTALLRAALTAAPFYVLMIGYRALRGRDGLGMGDVKLAAVAGAWLDWFTLACVIEGAAIAAIAAYAVRALGRRQPVNKGLMMPLGLFLAPAIWIGWLIETWLDRTWLS